MWQITEMLVDARRSDLIRTAERDHHAGELVTWDHRSPVPSGAVGPGRGPGQLGRRDARCVHRDQDVADAGDRSRRRLEPELPEVARLVHA